MMARKTPGVLAEDGLIELLSDAAIDNMELRYGIPSGAEPFLHKGRYIVEYASPGEVRLADADWDENGQVTYHSTKHAHIITEQRSVDALKSAITK